MPTEAPDAVAAALSSALADDRGTPLAHDVRVYTGRVGGVLAPAAHHGSDGPAADDTDDTVDHERLTRLVTGRVRGRQDVRGDLHGEVFTLDGDVLAGVLRGPADGTGDCALVLTVRTTADELLCVVALGGRELATHGPRRLAAVTAGIRLRELVAAAELAGLADTVRGLRAEAGLVDTLHAVGTRLTAQLDIDAVVQEATDAATTATGASFGAFFYNLVDTYGESYTLYTLSGVPREAFSRFPMPRNTEVFAPTFDGTGTTRSADIVADARFGRNPPYYGMPQGHLPVRSYLAVPVVSPTTREVLGGFFFGHPEPGRFTGRHEYLAEGIAGYAAIALDNARLFDRERNLASELARSMLPVVPDIPHLRIVARYLPAATGMKVGGDWFDVIELGAGRTAFVIGDVVGHGVTAAAVMGQVRTAIRSYALLDLTPSELLRNVSQLTGNISDTSFVTCFYAVHDPAGDTLTYANAGHLPAVLVHPDGEQEQVGEALAQPLGVGSCFPQRQVLFPPGADLVLYTDGLVESRTRDLDVGIANLLTRLAGVRANPDTAAACDALVAELTGGEHDDDVALIHVHHHSGDTT